METRKIITLVEVVIIATAIAILSAILVPTYLSLLRKANLTTKIQLAESMNELLSLKSDEINNFQDVIVCLENGGYKLDKLNPTKEGYRFVWDKSTNQIILLNEDFEVALNSKLYNKEIWQLWLTIKNPSEVINTEKMLFNYYLANDYEGDFEITSLSSFDTGNNVLTGNVIYSTTKSGITNISGNINGELIIKAPNAIVNLYAKVNSLKTQSLGTVNVFGYVKNLDAKASNIKVYNNQF
jgi:Tfp pilus assembly protein FimT